MKFLKILKLGNFLNLEIFLNFEKIWGYDKG